MKVFNEDWNVDDLIAHIRKHGANVEQDNDGQIMLYTDLFIHKDGCLHTHPKDT